MTNQLNAIEAEALAAIAAAESLKALEDAEIAYLGRKAGKLTGMMKVMGSLTPAEKPLFGQAFNETKGRVDTALTARREQLAEIERSERERAETWDITLPGRARPQGRLHPLTLAMDEFKRVMIGLGFEFIDGPDIEHYRYNFEWLNFPPDHPAMDEQDSFYIATGSDDQADRYLLRTQTTALQGRFFETGRKPPFRIATIGRCFRNEDMDETHSHTFHQVDGFSVAEGISLADLKGVLTDIYRGIFGPDAVVRFRPDFFPFVEPGVEVAVRWVDPRTGNARWLEMGGAGLIHPNIMRHAGFDPDVYTGFAFGLGIDRMPMRRYGIDDLRLFLENDLRFLQQF